MLDFLDFAMRGRMFLKQELRVIHIPPQNHDLRWNLGNDDPETHETTVGTM